MNIKEIRLMKTEEVRNRARELLQMPKVEVLTKYMFQEQEIERLNKENNNLKEDFKRHIDRINELTNRIDKAIDYIMTNHCLHLLDKSIINSKELIDILKGSDNNEK